jgi:hypothetical protein
MYLSKRDLILLDTKEGVKIKTTLNWDDDWKRRALTKLSKEGYFKKVSSNIFLRTNKPLLTNLKKARIIASNTFLSGEQDPLEKYKLLEEADQFAPANDIVDVWQPFETWRVGELVEAMDTLTNEIISSFELNPDKV